MFLSVHFKLNAQYQCAHTFCTKIVHEQHADTRTAGDVFDEWLYPLHTGEAFGLTGQFIILMLGLIPLVLYVTGVIRWLQKRRAKKHSVGQLKPGK